MQRKACDPDQIDRACKAFIAAHPALCNESAHRCQHHPGDRTEKIESPELRIVVGQAEPDQRHDQSDQAGDEDQAPVVCTHSGEAGSVLPKSVICFNKGNSKQQEGEACKLELPAIAGLFESDGKQQMSHGEEEQSEALQTAPAALTQRDGMCQ